MSGAMWDVKLYGGGRGGDIDYLKRRNPLPALDQGFRFDDSPDPVTGLKRHDYYITDEFGERRYHGSCTGIIAEYKRKFDAKAAYDGMVAKGRIANPDDVYFGMTLEECVAQWDGTRELASSAGSRMHAEIEKFYNNCALWLTDPTWNTDPHTQPSLQRFMRCHLQEVVAGELVPFRTELNIWDEEFEFAGQCDMLFKRKEWLDDPEKKNWVIIEDHKRTKKDLTQLRAYNDERMLGVCNSLPAVARSEYQLQMTLYSLILQRRTNLIVKEFYIGVFRINNSDYLWIKVEPLYDIALRMLLERRQKLLRKYPAEQMRFTEALRDPALTAEQRDDLLTQLSLATRGLRGLLRKQVEYGAPADVIAGAPCFEQFESEKKRKTED